MQIFDRIKEETGKEGQNKGRIFDIRRFSTHDGSGIRTTVFFKGCPLRCVWCHNPEGIQPQRRVMYFPNRCIGCRRCLQNSVNGGVFIGKAFKDKDELPKESICLNISKEENWDKILEDCPSGAMAWDSAWMSVDEVVLQVMKDLPFYRHGGGVTLSGGEPLMQPEFALEVLKELKQRGVHTAIETALYVPREVLKKVLPFLDYIYADCKLLDSKKHLHYTGVPNALILENLQFLLESDKRDAVTIRTPMIPNITAAKENIAAISRFLSGIYPKVSYELLNYNPLAEAKYHLLDKEYYQKDNPERYSQEVMEAFGQVARDNGIKQLMLG